MALDSTFFRELAAFLVRDIGRAAVARTRNFAEFGNDRLDLVGVQMHGIVFLIRPRAASSSRTSPFPDAPPPPITASRGGPFFGVSAPPIMVSASRSRNATRSGVAIV
jgi:hypothetical protein